MPIWPWKAHMRPKAWAASSTGSSTSLKPSVSLTTHGAGAKAARACDRTTGRRPGPPPPCGVEKVLCRLMCMASTPRSPGRTRPTMALKFAPSQ
jgi:hypothetical protein